MFECVRELGISEWLVWKVEEIYVRTKSKEKEGDEWFESTKGVTQAARLPPCYLLYMADMDEMLKKAQAGGGSVVGREKVWSLAFANDLVKVKRNLKKWWRARKRTVCEEEKARRECWEDKNDGEWVEMGRKKNRTSKRVWIPLGYTFNKRATNKAHMKEIVRKANKVVGCVWVKKLATEIKMSDFFWKCIVAWIYYSVRLIITREIPCIGLYNINDKDTTNIVSL
jgi:hypothetical protein